MGLIALAILTYVLKVVRGTLGSDIIRYASIIWRLNTSLIFSVNLANSISDIEHLFLLAGLVLIILSFYHRMFSRS